MRKRLLYLYIALGVALAVLIVGVVLLLVK